MSEITFLFCHALSFMVHYWLFFIHLWFIYLVRSRLGPNNNPTPLEFKHIYRRLLLGVTNGIVNHSNIELQDTSEIVAFIPDTQNKIAQTSESYNLNDVDFDYINNVTVSNFNENVVEYISGFVVRKVSNKLFCEECCNFIVGSQPTDSVNLIVLKDYGNFMCYPTKSAKDLFILADKIIDMEVKASNWLTDKYFFDKLCLKIVQCLIEKSILSLKCNHQYSLFMKLVSCYSAIKLKHHSKLENERLKKMRVRNKLTRYVINTHE